MEVEGRKVREKLEKRKMGEDESHSFGNKNKKLRKI